jgi:hypothetical protein
VSIDLGFSRLRRASSPRTQRSTDISYIEDGHHTFTQWSEWSVREPYDHRGRESEHPAVKGCPANGQPFQTSAAGRCGDRHIVHTSRGVKMWQLREAGSLEGTCAQYPPAEKGRWPLGAQYPPAEKGRWPLGAQYPPAEGIFFSLS